MIFAFEGDWTIVKCIKVAGSGEQAYAGVYEGEDKSDGMKKNSNNNSASGNVVVCGQEVQGGYGLRACVRACVL